MPEEFDPLSGTSGFPQDFWGEIISAAWEQGDNSPKLKFNILNLDDDEVVEPPLSYFAPGDWVAFGPDKVVPKSGAKRGKFRTNSRIQEFIDSIMEIPEALAELRRRVALYDDAQGPMHSDFFNGMVFYFGEKEFPGREQVDGEWKNVKVKRVVPTEYRGVRDSAGSLGSGTPASPSAPTPSASLDADTLATLTRFAGESSNKGEFMDKVLDAYEGTPYIVTAATKAGFFEDRQA